MDFLIKCDAQTKPWYSSTRLYLEEMHRKCIKIRRWKLYWMGCKKRIIILLTTPQSDRKERRKAVESFHGFDFSLVLCFSFPENKNPCHLSEAPGPCRGLLSRYYYDSKSQQCKHFFYGGCFGNANNFRSMVECQAKCQSPGTSICLDTTSPVLKAWKMMSFLNKMGWAITFFFAVIDE